MEILYLSSLCSVKEYERMFNLYGTTSSHASQKFNRLLVYGLRDSGCQIDTLTQRIILHGGMEDKVHPDEQEAGICYHYLPRHANHKLNRLLTIWNTLRAIFKWHKEHPSGIVICDIILGELSIAACVMAKLCGIKTIAIVTDVPAVRAGGGRKNLRGMPVMLKNWMISRYSGYIFLTEAMNELLNPKHRPYVIVEGIVDETVKDIRNTLEDKYPEKVCIMAGLLEDVFGVNELLNAFMNVENAQARLYFYGKGTSISAISEAAEKDARICYKGELPNQKLVLEEKKATLLINPRPAKGEWTKYSFPSKNMEYMASGTPLVAYDLPCIPEEYREYFFHIPCNDVEGFAEYLQQLLSKDRAELHAFGHAAQEWIVGNKCASIQGKAICHMIEKCFVGGNSRV